ncbi:MAG: hypothetical protein HFJ21_03555 [Clostridia bacterium]|nr:hypothetical protein [Clostridia bacterium]MCI9459521.1 hypothetical protein [Clostridia bacterium]
MIYFCVIGLRKIFENVEHRAVSRISILSDMQSPKPDDNTQRTYSAYLPLVAACRPDWDEDRVKRVTHCLIASMQQSFLRSGAISDALGADIKDKRASNYSPSL